MTLVELKFIRQQVKTRMQGKKIIAGLVSFSPVIFTVISAFFLILINFIFQSKVIHNNRFSIVINGYALSFYLKDIFVYFFLFIIFILKSPLTIGKYHWYYWTVRGYNSYLTSFYWSYKSFFRAVAFRLVLSLRLVFWTIISFIPAIISFGVAVYTANRGISLISRSLFILSSFVGICLLVIGSFLFINTLLNYFLSSYLVAGYDSLNIRKCFKYSKLLVKQRKNIIVHFYLYYWYIFFLAIFILPVFILLPLLHSASAALAEELISSAVLDDTGALKSA